MRIEPFAHCDEPTARVDQVLEVHGAVLVLPELGHDDRQHRTANDARLYECARIQADDRRTVHDRIEIVGPRALVDRIAAPDHCIQLARVDRLPLCGPRWMRAHEHARLAQRGMAACPYAPDPFEHERRFGYGGHGGLIDNGRVHHDCLARLVAAIQTNHGVTSEQVRAARAHRDWRFDLAVAALFLPLYWYGATVVCRGLARRFGSDEPRVRIVATGLTSLVVGFLGGVPDQRNSFLYATIGNHTIPVLQGLGIEYKVLEDGEKLEIKISDAVRAANALRAPYALLFAGEFSE